MKKFYYHITDKKNLISIMKDGLKENADGDIFVFDNMSVIFPPTGISNMVADCIAINQINLSEYVMFDIDSKGIKVEVINDNVADSSAQHQWIVKQTLIDPEYLSFFGLFKTSNIPFFEIPNDLE